MTNTRRFDELPVARIANRSDSITLFQRGRTHVAQIADLTGPILDLTQDKIDASLAESERRIAVAVSGVPSLVSGLVGDVVGGASVRGTGSTAQRPVAERFGEAPTVLDFIDSGDTRTKVMTGDQTCPDLSTEMQRAVDQATSRGVKLIGMGTIPLGKINDQGSLLLLRTNTVLEGIGRDAFALRQIYGTNARDIVSTDQATTVWTSGGANHGRRSFFGRCRIEGYKLQNAPNTDAIGSAGLRVYGLGHVFEDLIFQDIPGAAIRTAFRGPQFGYRQSWDGSTLNEFLHFRNIEVSQCGMQAFVTDSGPTDIHIYNFFAVDPCQWADNTYAAFHNKSGNWRGSQLHSFSCQYPNTGLPANQIGRFAYALLDEGGGLNLSDCHWEGALTANVRLDGVGSRVDGKFYNSRGPSPKNLIVRGQNNTVIGQFEPANPNTDGSGAGPVVHIVLGVGNDICSRNIIIASVGNDRTGQTVDFTNSQGGNTILWNGFQSAPGVGTIGFPHPLDTIIGDLFCNNVRSPLSPQFPGKALQDDTGWIAYAPNVFSGSGAFGALGTPTGSYQRVGKTVRFTVAITITSNGSAGGFISASLPLPAKTFSAFSGGQQTAPARALRCISDAGSSVVTMVAADGSYPGADGALLIVSGEYETV